MSRRSLDGGDRAQTLPDLVLGLAIFFVAIMFVSIIVPQLTLPYGDHDEAVVADRLTAELANDRLVDTRPVGHLNESATKTFFEDGPNSVEALDIVPPGQTFNVTLRAAPSYRSETAILCPKEGESWITATCEDTTETFAIGPAPPPSDDAVSTGRATLYTTERTAVLEVKVWSHG